MILILGALEQEIDRLLSIAQLRSSEIWGPFSIHQGILENCEVCIVKCGIGKVLSAMLTQHLIDKYSPNYLLFTGLAGALKSQYDVGDIVLGRDCVQHDLDAVALGFTRGRIPYTDMFAFPADSKLLNNAKKFKSDEFSVFEGRILTGDQFISKSADSSHDYLITELNGDVVDMEGASVAIVATINKIPFLIMRTVSDRADGVSPKSFTDFLPLASKHSSQLIRHLLVSIYESSVGTVSDCESGS